jgi:hypothetical protein
MVAAKNEFQQINDKISAMSNRNLISVDWNRPPKIDSLEGLDAAEKKFVDMNREFLAEYRNMVIFYLIVCLYLLKMIKPNYFFFINQLVKTNILTIF